MSPKIDLAAVLPHDDRGRPLALASGFPGIRHNIVLRASNASEWKRWKETLTHCVKLCNAYEDAARSSIKSPVNTLLTNKTARQVQVDEESAGNETLTKEVTIMMV